MSVRIGYACLTLGVAGTELKNCTWKSATAERLRADVASNLDTLGRMIAYNSKMGIRLFRISSDLIPFGSRPDNPLPWQDEFKGKFERLGEEIRKAQLRVSMHPGQYTVLNSPDDGILNRTIDDLLYHDSILNLLGTDKSSKIVLHVGGVYGDKEAALGRFCRNWAGLNDSVKSRIVLENDERSYNIAEVVELAHKLCVPAIFDNLHHEVNSPLDGLSPLQWIERCSETWKAGDGRQKIHYSQQSHTGKTGAHSSTVSLDAFLPFYESVHKKNIDIMLEVKDKNLSAIKCITAVSGSPSMKLLEQEWEKYKYVVMEHSPSDYQSACQLLEEPNSFPVTDFYSLIDSSREKPIEIDKGINTALQVWRHLEDWAYPQEKKSFLKALEGCQRGRISLSAIKNRIFKLAQKYEVEYLLNSYYFI